MSILDVRIGHLGTPCCHPTRALHTSEMALLVALMVEHNVSPECLTTRNSGGVEQILGLLDAHGGAAKAMDVWRTAGVLS